MTFFNLCRLFGLRLLERRADEEPVSIESSGGLIGVASIPRLFKWTRKLGSPNDSGERLGSCGILGVEASVLKSSTASAHALWPDVNLVFCWISCRWWEGRARESWLFEAE